MMMFARQNLVRLSLDFPPRERSNPILPGHGMNQMVPVGTNEVQIRPLSSFSFIKCLLTSTCLVRSCCTGLRAILIADLLSQCSFMRSFHLTVRSSRTILIHSNSQNRVPWSQIQPLHLILTPHYASYSSRSQYFPIKKYNIRMLISYQSLILHNQHPYRLQGLNSCPFLNRIPLPGVPFR